MLISVMPSQQVKWLNAGYLYGKVRSRKVTKWCPNISGCSDGSVLGWMAIHRKSRRMYPRKSFVTCTKRGSCLNDLLSEPCAMLSLNPLYAGPLLVVQHEPLENVRNAALFTMDWARLFTFGAQHGL